MLFSVAGNVLTVTLEKKSSQKTQFWWGESAAQLLHVSDSFEQKSPLKRYSLKWPGSGRARHPNYETAKMHGSHKKLMISLRNFLK